MRIDLLEAFGLAPNVIAILKEKYGEILCYIQQNTFLFPDFFNKPIPTIFRFGKYHDSSCLMSWCNGIHFSHEEQNG